MTDKVTVDAVLAGLKEVEAQMASHLSIPAFNRIREAAGLIAEQAEEIERLRGMNNAMVRAQGGIV